MQLKDIVQETRKMDVAQFQKMVLLHNAVEQGWSVKKRQDSYVFTKSHEGKKEVFEEAYLMKFIKTNMELSKVSEKV